MRLVHVATAARFWPFLSGQPRYLKARGFQIHAASAGGPELDAFAEREGIHPWVIPMSRRITPLRDLGALWRLWRLFLRLRPEVVHAHTPKAGLLAMLAARASRVPARVYMLHGLVWQTRRGWGRRGIVFLERLSCRLAGRVLAVSESVRQAALAEGLAGAEKIVVAGPGSANGIDLERFDPRRLAPETIGRLRARYGIPEGSPVVGFVGRLNADKGIADLAAAWAILQEDFPSLHLVIAGETEDHHPPPHPAISLLLQHQRVHFAGWTPDMPEHYGLLDVCLLPSRREGLPYAALEAAAMERPVVGFRVTGTVDAVEDGETGWLVPPAEAAGLAAGVARLLRDPVMRERMGAQARRRCESRYQQEPVWESIYRQYLSLAGGPQAPRPLRLRWKRPLDLALAVALLVSLAPLLALLALVVLADLGPPVLFRQRRTGRNERPFELLKFRTMPEDRQPRSPLSRLGRFLRRRSLDELPQLFNIARGEMSFIGPRPLLERYRDVYTEAERRRHLMRPGLTGWAQIHGRNNLPWSRRLEMDVWYVDHGSWRLDGRIALATVWKLLTAQGVEEDPSAVMLDLDAERQTE